MYEIEKDVEMPLKGEWWILASKMEPGDSVEVANRDEASLLVGTICKFWKKHNAKNNGAEKRFRAKSQSQSGGTYRVWRVT